MLLKTLLNIVCSFLSNCNFLTVLSCVHVSVTRVCVCVCVCIHRSSCTISFLLLTASIPLVCDSLLYIFSHLDCPPFPWSQQFSVSMFIVTISKELRFHLCNMHTVRVCTTVSIRVCTAVF